MFPTIYAAGFIGLSIKVELAAHSGDDHAMPECIGYGRQVMETTAKPPEGTHANAGAAETANLPVPEGATPAMVALGDRIYHGQVGGAAV